jgi:SAM-dependent methyltransferase
MNNVNQKVVEDFGKEWLLFDQSSLSIEERSLHFNSYFNIFPWDALTPNSVGFDAGCGSGRWAYLVAPRVGSLHCIEPSDSIGVAKKNLSSYNNCIFHKATIDSIPLEDESMDFGYCLGVVHHIPDTQKAINDCTRKLKIGAPFLLYIYYKFDNKPTWFKYLWKISDMLRRVVSKLPNRLRYVITQIIATSVYYPLARFALLVEKFGIDVDNFPLSVYRNRSFYSMRTDALDRFGTRLEHRFTKKEIQIMMEKSGLTEITFSNKSPYWCAFGVKNKRW